jgi:hypothetical protein
MLQTGICIYNSIACRKEASHSSEMTTQLLFGETYQILEQHDEWLLISIEHDEYTCWIRSNQHTTLNERPTGYVKISDAPVVFIEHEFKNQKQLLPLFAGSRIPESHDKSWKIQGHVFNYLNIEKKAVTFTAENIKILSSMFLHTPYLWGGRTPAGIDCSGFVQVVMGMMGIPMNRDASQQVEQGEVVNFIDEVHTGDLAYFDNEEGKITHVGIMLDQDHIIHASGCVRIDKLDHEGIFNADQKKYTHRLRIIKRVF